MQRVIVYTQAFEDKNVTGPEGSPPCFRFKFGSEYEVRVPEGVNTTNVIAAMFTFLVAGQDSQDSQWREFPINWAVLTEGQLTETEALYQGNGASYTPIALKYENHKVTGRAAA